MRAAVFFDNQSIRRSRTDTFVLPITFLVPSPVNAHDRRRCGRLAIRFAIMISKMVGRTPAAHRAVRSRDRSRSAQHDPELRTPVTPGSASPRVAFDLPFHEVSRTATTTNQQTTSCDWPRRQSLIRGRAKWTPYCICFTSAPSSGAANIARIDRRRRALSYRIIAPAPAVHARPHGCDRPGVPAHPGRRSFRQSGCRAARDRRAPAARRVRCTR